MPSVPIRQAVMMRMADQLGAIAAGAVYWTTPSLVTRTLKGILEYGGPGAPRLSTEQLVAAGLVTPDDFAGRGLDPAQEITQLDLGPVLGVDRAEGSTFERLKHHAEPAYLGFWHDMRVVVVGYVQATPVATAQDLIEQLWQDHLAALLSDDANLGGLGKDLQPIGDIRTFYGLSAPLAIFEQDWRVRAMPIAA